MRALPSQSTEENQLVVRLSSNAMAAVQEIASKLGTTHGEAVARALGLQLYLLKFAEGEGNIIIEDKKRTRRILALS